MKPYLYAPILFAGLLTIAGTASIATTEFHLVKTGQEVASMFRPRNIMLIDQSGANSASPSDLALRMNSDIDAHRMPELAPVAPQASPVVDVQMTPVMSRSEQRRPEMRFARRSTPTPHAMPTMPEGTLASHVIVPASGKTPNDFRVYVQGGPDKNFVTLWGRDGKCLKTGKVQFVFDAKKFAKQQEELAMQFKDLAGMHWASVNQKELKQLAAHQYALQMKAEADKAGTPAVITIDPLAAATAAEKAGLDEAAKAMDQGSDFSATPNQ